MSFMIRTVQLFVCAYLLSIPVARAGGSAIVTGDSASDIISALGTDDLTKSYHLNILGYVSEKAGPAYIYQSSADDGNSYFFQSADQSLIERLFQIASDNGMTIGFHAAGSSYKSAGMSVTCKVVAEDAECTLTDESVKTKQSPLTQNRRPASDFVRDILMRPLHSQVPQCLQGSYPSADGCPNPDYRLVNCSTSGGHFGVELCSCCK